MSKLVALLGLVGYGVIISLLTASQSVLGQTPYTVDELIINGQVIQFDVPTEVTVTEPVAGEANQQLRLEVANTLLRRKCAGSGPDTCVLYAGGGEPVDLDPDNDGFEGDADACPTVPGVAPDGCPATPPPSGSDYCAGVDSNVIECSNTVNHDSIYQASSSQYTLTEPAGSKILSVPFETVDAANAPTVRGYISYTSSESDSGKVFRQWLSETPGGAVLNSCEVVGYPRIPIRWNQDNEGYGCFLGSQGRVLYFNYEVTETDGGVYNRSFIFNAQRYVLDVTL